MISGYHIRQCSSRGTTPTLPWTLRSELPIQHQLLGKHQSPKHEKIKCVRRDHHEGLTTGVSICPVFLAKGKAEVTSGITLATVKMPIIKIHPQIADQRPSAGSGMISSYLPSVLCIRQWQPPLFCFSSSIAVSLFSLYVHFITPAPFTSQSCLYLTPKEFHNLANLVNQ